MRLVAAVRAELSVWRRFASRVRLILQRAGSAMLAGGGTRAVAQVAFYVVLSFPAALLLVVWLFSTALDDPGVRDRIVDAIVQSLPLADDEARRELEQILDEIAAGASGLGWIGIASLAYSASGAIAALRHAVNQAWGVAERRPYMQGKAVDVGMTAIIAPLAVAVLGLELARLAPPALGERPAVAGALAVVLGDVVPAVLAFLLFALLFSALPAERRSARAAWPGALAAVIGLVALRFGAEAYVGVVGNANAIYGTIGVVLGVMYFTYLAAVIVVFGAHVAAQAARVPTLDAIDRAIAADRGPGQPVSRRIASLVKGLFVRARRDRE